MKKKPVNPYFVEGLLLPFVGLTNGEVAELITLDSNSADAVREVIRNYVKPDFERYGQRSKEIVRNSLSYLLSSPDVDYEEMLVAKHVPFEPPAEPRNFFVWVWLELFGQDSFEFGDRDHALVQEDYHAPNLRYLR